MDKLFITMCVIAYNEENSINNILSCIKEQDYDHKSMEIVLVDGMSSDKTRDIMVDFAKNNENELVEVMEKMISDNNLRERLSKEAYKKAGQYSINKICSKWNRILKEI